MICLAYGLMVKLCFYFGLFIVVYVCWLCMRFVIYCVVGYFVWWFVCCLLLMVGWVVLVCVVWC